MGMRCMEIQDVLYLKLCLDLDGCECSDFLDVLYYVVKQNIYLFFGKLILYFRIEKWG